MFIVFYTYDFVKWLLYFKDGTKRKCFIQLNNLKSDTSLNINYNL